MFSGAAQMIHYTRTVPRLGHVILGLVMVLVPLGQVQAEVSQLPLYLGGGSIPGNIVLVPSVEYPTIESVANLGTYSSEQRFEGYFDTQKCYVYHYESEEAKRHFYPSSITGNRRCSGAHEWSGNYLNWATTPTIDPFRKVLTGGLRAKDTPTETWLVKARHPGRGGPSMYPTRYLVGAANVSGATPFTEGQIRVRTMGLGTKMRFSLNNVSVDENPGHYQPSVSAVGDARAFEMSVRVKVCDPVIGVEENCKQYADGWKPEGLIQQSADSIRFSVFGYLNQDDSSRDGGVLRARQKYVGPKKLVPGVGVQDNPNAEWDAVTGVMVRNPDPDDASSTSGAIADSGVINYLNKFGQGGTGKNKYGDPVSELYYAATRYLKNLGNVPSYTSMDGATDAEKALWRDGFPVITNWNDPIQYECQPNVILGIGDTRTHHDKNLPGNNRYRKKEPGMPDAIVNDRTVDVIAATNWVGQLEGLGNIGDTNDFEDIHNRFNSAYIAGLAYHNHTHDMRPDLAGKQTAATHWVDVLEGQVQEPPSRNQYYLAAKYGGFEVPEDYNPSTRTEALPEKLWHTNGDVLVPETGADFLRPDNYYVAGQADRMIESLRSAFANVTAELIGSSSGVVANSTRLDGDTAVFQASFNSRRWSGELKAFAVDDSGLIAPQSSWSASDRLDALTAVELSARNIFTNDSISGGESLSTSGRAFTWLGLSDEQRQALRATPEGALVSARQGEERLDYLRGNRAQERSLENQLHPFRQRDGRLGDIINSSPQFIHKQDFGYSNLSASRSFNGIDSYVDFRAGATYQNRPPMILVGANDGMLHGFNADVSSAEGGKELFAYVPSGVIDNLYELTLPSYSHRYYVDGTPRVADAWLGEDKGWRTIVAGTTGAGGRSIFVIDVTDPDAVDEDSFLWEFSHPELGFSIQTPAVVALPNGAFGVVVTSGYENGSENGKVWVLDAGTGQSIETFTLPGSGELGSPLVVDLTNDRIADRLYVGDSEGKLWRIDFDGRESRDWGVPSTLLNGENPIPLFTAPSGQAITAPLSSSFNEKGEHMVFFGTGSFFKVGENVLDDNPQVESFYGIVDGGRAVAKSHLVEQEILAEIRHDSQDYRVVSSNQLTNHAGWYIDLLWKKSHGGPGAKGERVVARPLVRSDRVIFSTLIPSENPCAAGGDSWLMEVNTFTGGRLEYTVFDTNGDGSFDHSDFVEVVVGNETILLPTSAVKSPVGIISTPAVLTGVGDNGDEVKVISGSSGQMVTIPEAGSQARARQSWEQLR